METKIKREEKGIVPSAQSENQPSVYEISFCCGAKVFYQPAGAFIFSVCPQCGLAYFPALIKVRLNVP